MKTLQEIFPLSDKAGADMNGLKTLQMQQLAAQRPPLAVADLKKILDKHWRFLTNGGAGGTWKMVTLQGIVTAIYQSLQEVSEGEQAVFEMLNLSQKLPLQGVQLPFANFCGVYCPFQDFSGAVLWGSTFTDAYLEGVVFDKTDLKKVDFSRANLMRASFVGANLEGADFENCNLKEANFKGANLSNCRFPGVFLDGVCY